MTHRSSSSLGRLSKSGRNRNTHNVNITEELLTSNFILCECSGSHVDGILCRSCSQNENENCVCVPEQTGTFYNMIRALVSYFLSLLWHDSLTLCLNLWLVWNFYFEIPAVEVEFSLGGVSSVCLPPIGWLIESQPSCSLHKEVASTCSVWSLRPRPSVWWTNDGLMRTPPWHPPVVTSTSQR